jgi:hypothetical protein
VFIQEDGLARERQTKQDLLANCSAYLLILLIALADGARSLVCTSVNALLNLLSTDTAFNAKEFLELIVKDENQCAAGATNGIRKGALEEGARSFIDGNLLPAIKG